MGARGHACSPSGTDADEQSANRLGLETLVWKTSYDCSFIFMT